MRELTVTRRKSMAGRGGIVRLYMEDPVSGPIAVDGVRCKKLGTLACGEQRAFPIEEGEVRLMTVFDRARKRYRTDFYRVPAGERDVAVSGKNRFNPITGHTFRFDGVRDADILQKRRRERRLGILLLCAVLLLLAAVGVGVGIALARRPGGQHVPPLEGAPQKFTNTYFSITMCICFY